MNPLLARALKKKWTLLDWLRANGHVRSQEPLVMERAPSKEEVTPLVFQSHTEQLTTNQRARCTDQGG